MVASQDCPKDAELSAWLQNPLDAEEHQWLTDHLNGCASCQNRLDQLDKAEGGMATAPLSTELLADLRHEPLMDALETEPECASAVLRARAAYVRSVQAHASQRPEVSDIEALANLGHYEILEVLGRGGMGIVYKAKQIKANRVVALKMILQSKHASVQDQVRFQIEAEAVAHLQHPNIVQLHEIGEHDGLPFFSLEFCDGGSLDKKLKTWTPTASEAASLVETLARAMHYAHLRRVVHRDLKPANVLLASDGTPKITDFGLAKNLDSGSDLSRSGIIMGTPSYMAPEQAEGKVRDTGPSADVYALGALLYELLAGRAPFKGTTPFETIQQVLNEEPLSPSRLRKGAPRDLETICLMCLRKSPGQRYASAEALADDLRRYQRGEAITARAVGRFERAIKWARRQPALAALLLVTVVGVAGIVWQWRKAVANEQIANRLVNEAHKRTKAERWERYRSNIAIIASAFRQQNFGAARRNLDTAPKEHRGWEWRHFASQLDGAQTVLRVETGNFVYCPVFDVHPKRLQIALHQPEGSPAWWDPSIGSSLSSARRHKLLAAGIAYSPDGMLAAVASDDNDIHVWNVNTGNRVCRLSGHEKAVLKLAFNQDGSLLASGGLDHEVRLWDIRTGDSLWVQRNPGPCVGLAFTPDGTRLVNGSGKALACMIIDEKKTLFLEGHTSLITDLAISPDGAWVASASSDPENKIRLWDLADGKPLRVISGHSNYIIRLAISPDGSRLASSSLDNTLRLWNPSSGASLRVLSEHTAPIFGLAFSPDSSRLLSGAKDETARLWDGKTGDLIAVLHGHRAEVAHVDFSFDGSRIITNAFDGTVRIWDAQSVEAHRLAGHQHYVYDVAFSPNGDQVASTGWDGALRLWDLDSGRQIRRMDHAADIVSSASFDSAGRRVATLSRFADQNERGRILTIWDAATGQLHRSIPIPGSNWMDSRAEYSPRGDLIAVGDIAGAVRLFDPATGAELAALKGHLNEVLDVAFRPDGAQFASGGTNGAVWLWDPQSQTAIATLRGHTAPVYRLAYSRDGQWLASASNDKTVRLWNPRTYQAIAELEHASTIYSLAFSPDGTRLAAGCADKTIRLWDLVRRQEVAELHGHEAYVHAVAFNSDGTRLVSASGDGTLRVWDTLSPKERAKKIHEKRMISVP